MTLQSKHVVHVYEVLRYVQSRMPVLRLVDRIDQLVNKISEGRAQCEAKRLGYCPGEGASCYMSCPLYLIQHCISMNIHVLCADCRFKWYCPTIDKLRLKRTASPCSSCPLTQTTCTGLDKMTPCYILYLGMLCMRKVSEPKLEDVVITTTTFIDYNIVEEFFKFPEVKKRAERVSKMLSTVSSYIESWYNKVCSNYYNVTTLLEHTGQLESQLRELEFCTRRRGPLGLEFNPDLKSVDMPSLIGFQETYNRVLRLLKLLSRLTSTLLEYYVTLGLVVKV